MRVLEPWHLVILAVVFVALFGAKRLPDSARSLGEAMHIFKKSIHDEHTATPAVVPTTTVSAAAPPPAPMTVPMTTNGSAPAGVKH